MPARSTARAGLVSLRSSKASSQKRTNQMVSPGQSNSQPGTGEKTGDDAGPGSFLTSLKMSGLFRFFNVDKDHVSWYGTEHFGLVDVQNMLTNIGILGALMMTVVAGCNLTVTAEELVQSDFRSAVMHDKGFQIELLRVLREEHPDFPLQYNISGLYNRKAEPWVVPRSSGIIDLEYILCCSPEENLAGYVFFWDIATFGSFWSFLEKNPTIRNLSTAATVITAELAAQQIAIVQRLNTFRHLTRRDGMETYAWPDNLKFDCHASTMGALCAFSAMTTFSFAFLATCICGCFLLYFAVLLLDDKQEETDTKTKDFMDTNDLESNAVDEWIMVVTPIISLLFFLLVAGMCSGFMAVGHVAVIRFVETYADTLWVASMFLLAIPIMLVLFGFLFWTVFLASVNPMRCGGSNRLSDIVLVQHNDHRRKLVFDRLENGTEFQQFPLQTDVRKEVNGAPKAVIESGKTTTPHYVLSFPFLGTMCKLFGVGFWWESRGWGLGALNCSRLSIPTLGSQADAIHVKFVALDDEIAKEKDIERPEGSIIGTLVVAGTGDQDFWQQRVFHCAHYDEIGSSVYIAHSWRLRLFHPFSHPLLISRYTRGAHWIMCEERNNDGGKGCTIRPLHNQDLVIGLHPNMMHEAKAKSATSTALEHCFADRQDLLQYKKVFENHLISPDQLKDLTVDTLFEEMKIPLGHAMAMPPLFQRMGQWPNQMLPGMMPNVETPFMQQPPMDVYAQPFTSAALGFPQLTASTVYQLSPRHQVPSEEHHSPRLVQVF